MLWQQTVTATIRALCVAAVVCYATGLSLAELAGPYQPIPVVDQDGKVIE